MPRRQCRHCPWKKNVDLEDIPAYSQEKHEEMLQSLRHRGGLETVVDLHIMACHETDEGKELTCVGWAAYELGPGNNLGLRMQAATGKLDTSFVLDGPQVESLISTLYREEDGA